MLLFLKRHWGFTLFALAGIASTISLLLRGRSAHYEVFTIAARKLWEGVNPYLYEHTSGFYNYSPSCGLYFYSLFAYFPDSVGLFLYSMVSLALLCLGLWRFTSLVSAQPQTRQIFFFLLSFELNGALLNARFETITLAVWMLCGSWILEKRRITLSYFLLAAFINFKMQSLSVVGLLLLVEILQRSNWKALWSTLAGLMFWYLVPLLHFDLQTLKIFHAGMAQNVNNYITGAWLGFQHVLAFVHRCFGVDFEWKTARLGLAGLGIFFGALVARQALREKNLNHKSTEGFLYAFALGSAFATGFSPMSQSAAYILYAPLLFYVLLLHEHAEAPSKKQALLLCLGIGFALVSLTYSDVVPRDFRLWLFEHAFKPSGILVLLAATALGAKPTSSHTTKLPSPT